MTLTLFAATLVICSLPALTQDQQSQGSRSSASPCGKGCFFFFDWSHYKADTPSEPWRLIAKTPVEVGGVNALDPVRIDQYHPDRHRDDSAGLFGSKAGSVWMPYFPSDGDEDTTCLKMRSYVVARDGKDSDSTHLVRYTTCQPSSRYGLKTTEMRTSSAER